MRIIPVLDLKSGQAVRALAGDREHYRPVRGFLHAESDPIGLACSFRDRLGLVELYLADLDALAGRSPALGLYRAIAAEGISLWVDAGIRDRDDVSRLRAAGVATIVAGLETLAGPDALGRIIAEAGPDRVVFSLDLRNGRPLIADGAAWPSESPEALARSAVAAGARRILLLDLARVGTGTGTGTIPLLKAIRSAWPVLEITIGGGVSGPADLERLAEAGASAVLVGSALHDGRIG